MVLPPLLQKGHMVVRELESLSRGGVATSPW